MKIQKVLFALLALMLLGACNSGTSLQEYFVDNQESNKFIAVDIPTSMFANTESLNKEQLATLETVKKVNLLAFPIKKDTSDLQQYQAEKQKLEKILSNEKYQLLMKYGSNNRKAEIYFTGKEDAIDEVILFGYDDDRGVGVARVLGEDMNPGEIMKFVKSLEKGDINFDGLKGVAGMFKDEIEQNQEKISAED